MEKCRPPLFVLFFLLLNTLDAQNWLLNGDFEERNVCPEYNAKCAPEAWFRLPPDSGGGRVPKSAPAPHSGSSMETILVEDFGRPMLYRSFIYTHLACPLQQGQTYTLRFYVCTGHRKNFTLGVQVCSVQPKAIQPGFFTDTPTLLLDNGSLGRKNKQGWRKVTGHFVAKGGEEYLVLGNFSPEPLVRDKGQKDFPITLFLLDDLELTSTKDPDCPDQAARKEAIYDLNARHPDLDTTAQADLEPLDTLESATLIAPTTLDTVAGAPRIFVIPDIGFDFGKFDLNYTAEPALRRCAEQIQLQNPAIVRITGYTDDVGNEDFNLELSLKRAAAVRQWFVDKGLPVQLFEIQGLGEAHPVAPNDTEVGRQANRRVEITFTQ